MLAAVTITVIVSGLIMSPMVQFRHPLKHFHYLVCAKALTSGSATSVGLRVRPNKTSQAIRRLTAGDELQVIARGQIWSRVVDPVTGKTGYVANDYLMLI